MKKCPNCNEKTLGQVEDMNICSTCFYIQSNKDKLTTIKKAVRIKEKSNTKIVQEKKLEQLQTEQTTKPYLRFRVFRIDIEE